LCQTRNGIETTLLVGQVQFLKLLLIIYCVFLCDKTKKVVSLGKFHVLVELAWGHSQRQECIVLYQYSNYTLLVVVQHTPAPIPLY
jgi:hypothetical protein